MLERPTRRGLITGLASLVAAPALVRAASLMPVSVQPDELVASCWIRMSEGEWTFVTWRPELVPGGVVWFGPEPVERAA